MTVTELLSQIYNEAERKGIDLRKFGIYDDEDLIIRALTFLSNDLEDIFYEDDINMDDGDMFEEESDWLEDVSDEDFGRIIHREFRDS